MSSDALPVFLIFLLFGGAYLSYILLMRKRGYGEKVVCPDCGLSYQGRDKPCPYCKVGPCPDCGAILAREIETCPYCGSDAPRDRLWP